MNMTTPEKRGSANSTYFIVIDLVLGLGIGMVVAGKFVETLGFQKLFLMSGILCVIAVFYNYFVSLHTYNKHKKV